MNLEYDFCHEKQGFSLWKDANVREGVCFCVFLLIYFVIFVL